LSRYQAAFDMAPVAISSGHGGAFLPDDGGDLGRNEQMPEINDPSPNDVPILEQLCGTRKKMRIAMLGAGVSGLNFFKFAEDKLKNVEIICYEKNADVGGTWYENRYPGCACDIPSVVYQYPWRPATWSRYYSYSPEIWQYIKTVEQENNFIEKYIKLRHRTLGLSWDEGTAQWTIRVEDLETGREFEDHADLIIDGGGVLNRWKWPDIEGLHEFKGKLLHSAQWSQDTDLTGKRVALIGAGSSAVQILPNIYNKVNKVYTWIRNKIWITAGFAQAFAGKDGANFVYNDEQRKLFENHPDEYLAYRKMIEAELNQRFSFIINGSSAQKAAREFSENEMRTQLSDRPDLLEKIMPTDFFVGCRRPTPGNGYLESLTGEKTVAFTEQLQRITEKGFIDPDGNEQEVDVIICATGFDTSYKPRFPLIVNGVDKGEEWKDQAHVPSYLSLALAGVPNYFVYGGAFCPSAHGSFIPLIQEYVDYTIQVIEKMQTENIRSLRPKAKVVEHFLRHAESFLKRTAWTGPCSSWFKGGKLNGIPAIYPGSRLHFLKLLERPRYEDFDIEYDDAEDMFQFFGNGFHVCERDGSDITWYMGAPKKEVDEEKIKQIMDGLKGIEMKRP
jgi:cation diffusion facilitator CzcD-associated flavoprotein CzcO